MFLHFCSSFVCQENVRITKTNMNSSLKVKIRKLHFNITQILFEIIVFQLLFCMFIEWSRRIKTQCINFHFENVKCHYIYLTKNVIKILHVSISVFSKCKHTIWWWWYQPFWKYSYYYSYVYRVLSCYKGGKSKMDFHDFLCLVSFLELFCV